MYIPVFLAHGALGIYDEVIFLGIITLFVVMMGISWIVSRNTQPTLDSEPTPETETHEAQDRFKLD
jgi:hypothetical protein